MKEQFCTYEIALKLKELGLDVECFAFYKDGELVMQYHLPNVRKFRTNSRYLQLELKYPDMPKYFCAAPTWQQAWSFILIKLTSKYKFISYTLYADSSGHVSYSDSDFSFHIQEQGILKCIELWEK